MARIIRAALPYVLCFLYSGAVAGAQGQDVLPQSKANVLVVYASDAYDQTKQLATAVMAGAESTGANVRLLTVEQANYNHDVRLWADAIVLGSGVYNGNAAPSLLEFLNSWDVHEPLLTQVGGAFATGGGVAAGLESVIQELDRSLRTFGVIAVGGTNWRNAHGTGAVTDGSAPLDANSHYLVLAKDQGVRIAQLASILKQNTPKPSPSPISGEPPSWGENWTALVSANLTQVGYDAGLVIVNFTGQCKNHTQQKMKTVYGDFDTVLTRCDLGREFIIDPPSRGGKCRARVIGRDVDARICEACSCPFCVRDTDGAFTHGQQYPSRTVWHSKERTQIFGRDVVVWKGTAFSSEKEAASEYALSTSVAYSDDDDAVPVFVNVTTPLWVQTEARIDNFSRNIDIHEFDIPQACLESLSDTYTAIV